jgi:PIN domain nuclease of toxin-antitoxin system
MNYLLDTHVVLWWFTDPTQIASKAAKIIADKDNHVLISCVSLWEMSIKKSLGRLTLPRNLLEVIHIVGFKILAIGPEEALGICDLPHIHHDPFDRMLVMQAKLHDLILITRDANIMKYPVITVKA